MIDRYEGRQGLQGEGLEQSGVYGLGWGRGQGERTQLGERR